MALNLKHAKQLTQPDPGVDALKLQPSDWNAALKAPAGVTENYFVQARAASADLADWDRNGLRLVNAPGRVLLAASSTTLANHTAVTGFDKVLTIPAGTLLDRARVTVEMAGVYSTTGTPTMTLQISVNDAGSLGQAIVAAIVCPSGASNNHWLIRWSMVIRTLGAGAAGLVAMELGEFLVHGAATPVTLDGPTATSSACDSTANWQFTCLVGWSAAAAGNNATLRTGSIRVEPAGTLVL